jgi:hypothetical protein
MHAAAPTARSGSTPGRHRLVIGPSRHRHAAQLAGWAGSVVSLAALALIGMAVAASLSDGLPPAERPTLIVTYDVGH